MEHFGIATDYKKDTIYIAPQSYKARDYTVAPDWTNASYFYLLPALSPNASITLQDLQRDTIQGDAIIQSIMEDFGVSSEAKSAGLTLHNSSQYCSQLQYDFTSYPDLVPTVLAACASTGIPATIRGVQHLAIKESNRLMVLKEAFRQLGVALLQKGKEWQCKGQVQSSSKMPVIDTYNDHRIAMALAPLAIPLGGIRIKDPLVVDKSFPQYWQQLKQVGFQLKPIEGAPDL